MSKIGAERNYKNGPKNNWRRTIWNQILLRTGGREHEQPVLYLTGPQDLDRVVAISKGLHPQNLIGIDRNRGNAIRIRKSKCPAIHGDVLTVLGSWPKQRPVAAVALDFCSGFELAAMGHLANVLVWKDAFRRSIVMVNLMRGRDPSSNGLRNDVMYKQDAVVMRRLLEHPCSICVGDQTRSTKNRALHFLAWQLAFIAAEKARIIGQSNQVLDDIWNLWFQVVPTFISYSSGTIVLDSVVYYNAGLDIVPAIGVNLNTECDHEGMVSTLYSQKAMSRSIAAILAIRTQRLGGVL